MKKERWGAFSVKDHLDTTALIPDILLYDRLVFPIPPDEKESQRWQKKGWKPELLADILHELGDLAKAVEWDAARMKQFHDKIQKVKVKFDVENMLNEIRQNIGYHLTRLILTEDNSITLPRGVSDVTVVAAYRSEKDFKADFYFSLLQQYSQSEGSRLGFLLGQKIAIPRGKDLNKVLARSIRLAKNDEFKKKRRKLYDWQENMLRSIDQGDIDREQALEEMDRLISDYNLAVKRANRQVYYKLAYTVGIASLSIAASAFHPLASAGAFLSIGKFIHTDRKPIIQAGESEPAAMFHDSKKIFGWRRLFRR